jgi:hypothetical protein
MKKTLILLLAICLVITLVRCDKNSQDVVSQEEQPITVGLEIDGKQSHEVRIK